MYGFSVTKKGILTDNYYQKEGYDEDPDSQGAYVLIRRSGNIIKINQDYYGNYGIYKYNNKKTGYFAFSNSFLLLVENLIGKQIMTFNKEFADSLVITGLSAYSTYETLIKEIEKIESNSYITINIKREKYEINYFDQKQNTIPFESEEGLKIIDKWADKWGFISRSLIHKTNSISMDLSGGLDTRTTFSLLYNSGINLNNLFIKSYNDTLYTHIEDIKIATNISLKYGFKLNENHLENNITKWGFKNALDCTFYSKLGFHKEFSFKNEFFNKPRFAFTGTWGELIRGYPYLTIQKYIEKLSSKSRYIREYEKENEFYYSSKRILERSINRIKNENKFNDYELSSVLESRSISLYHYGRETVESFFANIYRLEPLSDPELKKLKLNINEKTFHDLITYIYFRFAKDLINIPIQGNRTLGNESIEKAIKLNKKIPPYIRKSDFNKNFYIDTERKSPLSSSKDMSQPIYYIKKIIKDKEFLNSLNKKYNTSVYEWAEHHSKISNYFPLRHQYGLLAIVKVLDYLSLNDKILKNNNINI